MSHRILSFRQKARVVWAMAWSDFVLSYSGSFLGYLWTVIPLLVRFVVIFHIFRSFAGDQIQQFELYLFLGIVVWQFFASVTSGCISALHRKAGIIQKISFPRSVILYAVACQETIVFASHMALFYILTLFFEIQFSLAIFLFPLFFVLLLFLSLGVGMLLSSYSLIYKDIQHLWQVVLQVLFWLTPIMYFKPPSGSLSNEALTLLQDGGPNSLWSLLDAFIRFQPLSILMQDTRRVLLYSHEWGIPSIIHIIVLSALCIILLGVGKIVYTRRSALFLQEY